MRNSIISTFKYFSKKNYLCSVIKKKNLIIYNFRDVARSALKEAIMTAQEAGDNVCLQLAHAWMYHLTDEKK